MGQQGVLLGLVPAVDFIHEQDRAQVVELAPLDGILDHLAQSGDPIQDSREGHEVALGDVSDHHRQGGFASPRRAPKDDR